jgi:hypothetical protein
MGLGKGPGNQAQLQILLLPDCLLGDTEKIRHKSVNLMAIRYCARQDMA